MNFFLPGPEPRERNQLLWILSLGNLFLLLIARFLGPWLLTAQRPSFMGCLFHTITGHYCPFCGMTRAFTAAAQGNFARSLYENPMGLILIVLGLLLFLWQLFNLIIKCRLPDKFWHIMGKSLLFLLMANWLLLFFTKV